MEYELELEVVERIGMPDLSPPTADMQTRYTFREIVEKTLVGAEEAKAIEFESRILPDGQSVHKWHQEKGKAKKIVYTQAEMVLLKDRVRDLDAKKQITEQMLDLCAKIKGAEGKESEGDKT